MNDTVKPSAPPTETQTTRRIKYGVNVAVAALVAILLVVLLNVIAYRQYLRIDLTATRQYSLSAQTERVLGRLDDEYRIVSLFRVSDPQRSRVRDLIDEYARYSPSISVQHIDPALGIARRESFYRELRDRHRDALAPTVEAIEHGRTALRELTNRLPQIIEPLDQALQHPELPDSQLKQMIASVRARFTTAHTQLQQMDEGLEIALEQALPSYAEILGEVRRLLQELDGGPLAVAVERFERITDDRTAPPQVQDGLLGLAQQLKQMRTQVRTALEAVNNVSPAEQYNQIVRELSNTESVVVLSPHQVRVIDVRDMFRQPDPLIVQQTGQREVQFLGEERLTGALVSMSVEQPAMVVFVQSGGAAAIGPRGEYSQVAQRLQAANFRVEQWNPGGQMTAMGQQMPPQPPPRAAPGQQTIWIVLPFPPESNPMAMMNAGGKKQQVEEILQAGLAKGDAAMILLSVDLGAQFGAEDPVVDLVRQWGINPQLDRIVMQQVQLPNRQAQASAQFLVDQWPTDLPITKALTGMRGIFLQGCPLIAVGAEGVSLSPLVRLRGQQIWAEDDFHSLQASPQSVQFDPAASADAFTIGMAAQRADGHRLVVVADPAWASDRLTSYGAMGPGSAELFGAAFPGNSELFVNSVYWLAGLDELIAASPRTQDIRRIEPMSDAALYTYRVVLLAGVPLLIVAIGLSVWLVRRRG